MKTSFVYALKDPDTCEVRYVGKANDPIQRLGQHIRGKCRERCPRTNWLDSIRGYAVPILEIVDEAPVSEILALEAAYIQFFREEGCNLVNGTDGGDGVDFTRDVRKKMSAALTGDKNPRFGKPALNRGVAPSRESVEKNRQAHLGKGHCMETREKIRSARIGISRSLGTREKIAASLRARHIKIKAENVL